ncbi:MAG: CPBP family intramembrane glutamic endopeptidase [Actinomycetes bacterium]
MPSRHVAATVERTIAPSRSSRAVWVAIAVLEICVGATAVLLDVVVPTFVILVLMAVSLLIRHDNLQSLGLHRLPDAWRSAAQILALTVAWTVLQLALVMPLLEHATGTQQDLTDFADLKGNAAMLGMLLLVSWTIAAVGEELAYRGYLFTRITDIAGSTRFGVVLAVVVTSALFGLAHTEQGVIGVAVTFLDAIFFCLLRLHYRTLWASVLAHGFNNTIGLTAFFLVGPIYGLW